MFKQIGLYIKLAKVLLSGKKEIRKTMETHGWKSTRFWITLITIMLNVFGLIAGMLPATTVAWIVFGLTAIYVVFRTLSKITPTLKDDEIVAALEEPLKKIGVDTAKTEIPEVPKVPELPK